MGLCQPVRDHLAKIPAENGNVYAAVLSPEGVPVSAMHVAAMQDVMLGELGGTVKLTQAEDMSWWLGETPVADGSVHTHANGNMYALMLDSEGMWSAMYQKVEVMVDLGSTQESITLERAEDMSWRLGAELADVGSEVMSDSGNTYTLWYTNGVWSTQFEPELMMIEGTGLVAMTREGDDMYDVEDATLPASGEGDIDTSMGTYRVTMMDGMLMGTRLDKVAILGGVYSTIGTGDPSILADEDNTEDVNEGMTALKIADENHPFSALLGSGMSETQGSNYVSKARDELIEIRAKLAAVLDVFETEDDRNDQVRLLWGTNIDTAAGERARNQNVKKTLQTAFGTISGLDDDENNRVAPDDNDALSDIDDLIMALSSVDSLATALAENGALKELGVDANDMTATAIFDATESETSVSYGVLGGTRYGAISKKDRDDAVSKAAHMYDPDPEDGVNPGDDGFKDGPGDLGAFAFGVIEETVRTRHVASSGNAYYEGGTLAVDEGGTHYAGDISVRVRFSTDKVDGLITNLVSADGEPWVHVFDEVSSIVLPTQDLRSNATWTGGGDATISYALRAGSAGSQTLDSSFQGRLLGRGGDAGSEAHGTWSVGATPDADSYLAGGFGAIRVADEPDRRPTVDDGAGVTTTVLGAGGTYASNDTATIGQGGTGMTALEDGKLTVTVGKFGWSLGRA